MPASSSKHEWHKQQSSNESAHNVVSKTKVEKSQESGISKSSVKPGLVKRKDSESKAEKSLVTFKATRSKSTVSDSEEEDPFGHITIAKPTHSLKRLTKSTRIESASADADATTTTLGKHPRCGDESASGAKKALATSKIQQESTDAGPKSNSNVDKTMKKHINSSTLKNKKGSNGSLRETTKNTNHSDIQNLKRVEAILISGNPSTALLPGPPPPSVLCKPSQSLDSKVASKTKKASTTSKIQLDSTDALPKSKSNAVKTMTKHIESTTFENKKDSKGSLHETTNNTNRSIVQSSTKAEAILKSVNPSSTLLPGPRPFSVSCKPSHSLDSKGDNGKRDCIKSMKQGTPASGDHCQTLTPPENTPPKIKIDSEPSHGSLGLLERGSQSPSRQEATSSGRVSTDVVPIVKNSECKSLDKVSLSSDSDPFDSFVSPNSQSKVQLNNCEVESPFPARSVDIKLETLNSAVLLKRGQTETSRSSLEQERVVDAESAQALNKRESAKHFAKYGMFLSTPSVPSSFCSSKKSEDTLPKPLVSDSHVTDKSSIVAPETASTSMAEAVTNVPRANIFDLNTPCDLEMESPRNVTPRKTCLHASLSIPKQSYPLSKQPVSMTSDCRPLKKRLLAAANPSPASAQKKHTDPTAFPHQTPVDVCTPRVKAPKNKTGNRTGRRRPRGDTDISWGETLASPIDAGNIHHASPKGALFPDKKKCHQLFKMHQDDSANSDHVMKLEDAAALMSCLSQCSKSQ
mmetsp:Transcript_8697/g.11776  ORF Transcript_8697/g.11776 Transcript_8697/m.11776 type:complete len:747 (+) Transcript_8697:2-2242(+)|eukprot:CAMPEP_0196598710 /NCGR_PEP_ID=MMETSP1081-20130531/94467_1 /TAXON_ID=36882 /ORGANISM="Pyramimonas amylifera, Strain CCMP720" /LENGTH=746 /DNA_ID=CAMNT_0041924427 /DNA_START=1 /DNA_END=2241 /DNA_ORIENTATION=-